MSRIYNNRRVSFGKIPRLCIFSCVGFLLIASEFGWAEELLRSPSEFSETLADAAPNDRPRSASIFEKLLSLPVVFYRKFMSPYWGHKCSHSPSCSQYSLLAIRKHGPLIGFVLTFDRLQHESNEARYSPLIKEGGETKVRDPVENNDFWWYGRVDKDK